MSKKPNVKPLDAAGEKVAEEAIGRHISYASELFWGDQAAKLGVDISDIESIHIGVYRKLIKPDKVKIFERADHKLSVRYGLLVDMTPLTVEPPGPGAGDDDPPYDITTFNPSNNIAITYVLSWDLLGDVAFDDADELAQSGFPRKYARVLGKMSREAREVYKTHIDAIKDIPPELSSVKPKKFVQKLAAFGTYGAGNFGIGVAKGGAYFPKWEAGKEGKAPFFANYSPEMLGAAAREIRLQHKKDYLLLKTDNGYRLLMLYEKDGELRVNEVIASLDSFHDPLEKGKRPRYTAIFFSALDGEKYLDPLKRRTYEVTSRGAERLLLDPRRMVEELVGEKSAPTLLGLGEPFDWFVEMVSAYFPSRYYVLDYRTAMVRPAQQHLDGLKEWADQATRSVLAVTNPKDPFFDRLDELRKNEILALVDTKDVIVLPQGFMTSGTGRFIGCDRSWSYTRDIKNGAVFIRRNHEFVRDLYIGGISQRVYEGSAGMIPLLQVMFGAAIAIPIAIFAGPAAVARYIQQELTRKALDQLVKDLAKRMVPVIAAQMTSMVATIFIYASDENDPKGNGHLWRAFADGFFTGYLVNTLTDSFFRGVVENGIKGGIKEYRYYVWAKRIYAAVDKVQEVVQTLEGELDEQSIKKGMDLFKEAVGHLGEGLILLVSALYYSDYDDAEAALEVFGAGPDDEPPPDPAQWELEAGAQLAHIAAQILPKLENIDDLLASLKSSKTLKVGITVAILNPYIWQTIAKTWQNRPFTWKKWEVKYIRPARPAIIMVVIASMVGALVYADDQTDGVLSDMIWGLVSDLPGAEVARAKVNGEIIGNVLGVFAFNSFIHKAPTFANKKKKWASKTTGEKWASLLDTPILGTAISNNMKIGIVGPILKLVFKRYVSLYTVLMRKGVFALAHSEETIKDFLSVVDDATLEAQNLGRLTYFRTEEESVGFTLERLVMVLFRLRTMLARDLQSYLEAAYNVPEMKEMLADDLEAFQKLANDSGLSAAVEKHAHTTYKIMTVQLHAAVSKLEEALKALMTGFTSKKKKLSWLGLLRELGLDIDIDKAEDALQREKERLKDFQTR